MFVCVKCSQSQAESCGNKLSVLIDPLERKLQRYNWGEPTRNMCQMNLSNGSQFQHRIDVLATRRYTKSDLLYSADGNIHIRLRKMFRHGARICDRTQYSWSDFIPHNITAVYFKPRLYNNSIRGVKPMTDGLCKKPGAWKTLNAVMLVAQRAWYLWNVAMVQCGVHFRPYLRRFPRLFQRPSSTRVAKSCLCTFKYILSVRVTVKRCTSIILSHAEH